MPLVTLAVDAGGTKLLGGLVTDTGEVLLRRQVRTPRSRDACDPGLVATSALAAELLAAAEDADLRVVATGLGFPEYVRDGVVTSREVFGWTEQPRDVLAALNPGRPVVVEADVRCAAYAEAATREPASAPVFYVSWGTGLSTTVIVDGQLLPGRRGEALALGEWPVSASVDATWSGNLETFASGLGMQRRYETAAAIAATRPVALLALDGDPIAEKVLDTATRALADSLAHVALLLDPDVIVLGGGIGAADGEAVRRVTYAVHRLLHRPDPTPVESACAGSDAGLVGAGLLAWAHHGVQPSGRGRPEPNR